MKNKKLYLALLAACLLNFLAHLYFYPSLPDTVPTHWGFDGQADAWGPKSSTLIICALPLLILLMLAVLPKIDPRSQNYDGTGLRRMRRFVYRTGELHAPSQTELFFRLQNTVGP